MITPAREYRIAAELRRCCWYAIVAVPVLCAAALWVTQFNAWLEIKRDVRAIVIGHAVLLLIVSVAAAWPLRWRLRVDAQGLSRRRYFWWDDWSWFDLSRGAIRKQPGPSSALHDPARPWWRRTLALGNMDARDSAEVLAAINAHYQVPTSPALPESLVLRYQAGCSLTLNSKGLCLRVGRKQRHCLWSEVCGVLIKRLDPKRRDFTNAVVILPDREVELFQFLNETPTTREVAHEFFVRYVPAVKIDVTLTGEPPNHRGHIERELRKKRKTHLEMTICITVCFLLMAACLVAMAIEDRGVLRALVMAGMTSLTLVPVVVYFDRLQRKRIADLETRLREVAGEV